MNVILLYYTVSRGISGHFFGHFFRVVSTRIQIQLHHPKVENHFFLILVILILKMATRVAEPCR